MDEREYPARESELIASGEYESNAERIMKGFKIFQRRYVFKSTVLQVTLLAIAAVIQFVNIAVSGVESINVVILMILMAIGLFILQKPRLTYNKLAEAIKGLDGIVYRADMYTDKIIVTTVYDPQNDVTEEKQDDAQEENGGEESQTQDEYEGPPATIIKLTESVVDVICTEDMFIAYIKGNNIYVIPRDAFNGKDTEVAERYRTLLGTRFILM